MLKALNVDQARFIALLAKTARTQRDAVLGHVGEAALDGEVPERGQHNPTAELGFDPLPAAALQPAALNDAIASLPAAARCELYALMRIGQGHLASAKWHRGLAEAETLGTAAVAGALIDDPDLHDHIAKGLFEAKLAQ